MADIFFNEEEKQPKSDVVEGLRQQAEQQTLEHQRNRDLYGIELPDEIYSQINQSCIANSENPEEEAYRWGCAFKYSQALDIPLQDAYSQVDEFNKALYPNKENKYYRDWYKVVADYVTLGNNTVKQGMLGNKLMQAHAQGDKELAASIQEELKSLNALNETLQDNVPRNWTTEVLKAGAQSLPFTGYVAAAGLIGNFIMPAAGTGASFATSSYLSAGQEYVDMLENGASEKTARIIANASGAIQGAIEADLGLTKGIQKGAARLMGKEVKENIGKRALKQIEDKAFKRFHFGVGKKMLVKYLEDYTGNLLGEGTEEFLQEWTSIAAQELAASMDGYDIPDDDFKTLVKRTTEAFKGGVLGAIALGFVPSTLNAAADLKSYRDVKTASEEIESETMFKNVVEDSPVFAKMDADEKAEAIHETWLNGQARKTADENEAAITRAEVNSGSDTFEDIETDEETGETNAKPVYREESGELYTEDNTLADNTHEFIAGDPNQETKNNYGYINYSEDGDTVTITKFDVNSEREGLRQEIYNQFAREHAGQDIKWDAAGEDAIAVRQSLINANPRGTKSGLNYYESISTLSDQDTRKSVTKQIKDAYNKVGKNLTNDQLIAHVALLESIYKRLGKDIEGVNNFTDYIGYTFGNNIFGDAEEVDRQAKLQDLKGIPQGGSYASTLDDLNRGVKSIIYVTQNGDFSTFAHEVAHVARQQLQGDLLHQAEDAFGVTDHNWTTQKEEDFARGFEQFLKTGKAKNNALKDLFQKIAQFFVDVYGEMRSLFDVTPAIEDVYNELLSAGDENGLRNAEMAVNEMAKQDAKTREAEQARKTFDERKSQNLQKENIKQSEKVDTVQLEEDGLDYTTTEREDAATLQNAITKDAKTIEKTITSGAIAPKNAEAITKVLTDEGTTQQAKTNIIEQLADADKNDEIMIFQMISEDTIREITNANITGEILKKLKRAQKLTEFAPAAIVKFATGWENIDGKWKYETDDSLNMVKGNKAFIQMAQNVPAAFIKATKEKTYYLGDLLYAPEVFELLPWLKDARVEFYHDGAVDAPIGKLTAEGIAVNLSGLSLNNKNENGVIGVMVHEMQNLIQAYEYGGEKSKENFAALYDELSRNAEKMDISGAYTDEQIAKLPQLAGNKYDAEARRTAKRVIKSHDEKRINTFQNEKDITDYLNNRPKTTRQLYYQIIGELGATELDRREEVTTRIDNLNIARQMEDAKKDTKTIRLATGWERGADGKWKYELTDVGNVTYTPASLQNIKNGSLTWTDELGGVLKYPDLYHAYPELENMTVETWDFNDDPYIKGSFTGDKILLRPVKNKNRVELTEQLSTLLHEVQHAIQHIEGFGVGGNEKQFEKYEVRISNTQQSKKTTQDQIKWWKQQLEIAKKENDEATITSVKNILINLKEDLSDLNDRIADIKENALEGSVEIWGKVYPDAFEAYKALSGEVESRNVQNRLWMTAEERLNTLLSETADVAPEDQLVMFETAKNYNSNDMLFQVTKKDVERAIDYTKTFSPAEAERIQSNLNRLADTPWGKSAVTALNIRKDLNDLLNGKTIPEDSKWMIRDSKYKNIEDLYNILSSDSTKEEKIDELFNWYDFESESSLLGHPKKPANSVTSSFINCNPSEECAKWCYAAKGQTTWVPDQIIRREIVNFLIEADPKRAADLISEEYKIMPEFKKGVALRLLDTGDLSEQWLPFIKEVNNNGIACQVFSKRPELLEKIDPKLNVVMLSIDKSNTELADKYPNLPIAYVYSDKTDLDFLEKNKDRFLNNGGVILPLRNNHSYLSEESIKSLPNWANKFTCPIDAGWKELGTRKQVNHDTKMWNCSVCDTKEQGCFFKRSVKDREQFFATLKEMKVGEIDAIRKELNAIGDEKLRSFGLTDEQILEYHQTMDRIYDEKRKGYDPEREGGLLSGSGQFTQNEGSTQEGISAEEGSRTVNKSLLYQTAYHGSAADFEKFDTEKYGLSGEGSMSFGYGVYVSGSEDIARDYAKRQYADKYEGVPKRLQLFTQELDNARADKDVSFEDFKKKYEILLEKEQQSYDAAKEKLNNNEIDKEKFSYSEYYFNNAKENLDNVERLYQEEQKRCDDLIKYYSNLVDQYKEQLKNSKEEKRKLYTVEIPDADFIKWDDYVPSYLTAVAYNAVYDRLTLLPDSDGEFPYKGVEEELKKELYDAFSGEMLGMTLYNTVAIYLGGEKEASNALYQNGIVGIDYPAGTNFGTPDGKEARNYVLFNDDDAKIVNKLLFQTQQELIDDARSFDTWQEFYQFYETMGAPEITPIPYDADAQWFQTFWEQANNVVPEDSIDNETKALNTHGDENVQQALDALFSTTITSDPAMLDNFLLRVAEIVDIDLNSPEWQNAADAEEAAEREQIAQWQDFIETQLAHGSWISNAQRLQNGDELTDTTRRRMNRLIERAPRDYRAIYSEIMENEQYAVNPEDSISEKLKQTIKKYKLQSPNTEIERMSPEERRKLSEQVNNEVIAKRLKDGTLKLDDELDMYIKSLNKQIKAEQDEYTELEKRVQQDFKDFADTETHDLLKLNDKLLHARMEYNRKNDEISRKIKKGLKISGKYEHEAFSSRTTYNELFRKYSDLKATMQITAEIEAALKRQEQVYQIKEDLNSKQKEKNVVKEIKDMRIKLVKRVMRRVPFNRIDYENAKTLTAIQRMLEPNLLGGVNRWIGTEGPYLRGIISDIITDADYKKDMLKYLKNHPKQSQAYIDFIKKVENLKSIKDFDEWTQQERKNAIRYFPKENWVKELNLMELAKEREEAIDLDIELKEYRRPLIDQKTGKVKLDKDGMEMLETAWKVAAADDIKQLVKDAVGDEMYNQIVNVPVADWTTEQMEQLAIRVNELYKEGRDLLQAKRDLKKKAQNEIRQKIQETLQNTGIVINDDDTPEEIKKKTAKINKILGLDNTLSGTVEGANAKHQSRINRILHSYNDANIRRVARILDNYSEGVNTTELYWKEDECYNNKQRSIDARSQKITDILTQAGLDINDLYETVEVDGNTYTIDELLYFLAADEDYVELDKDKNDNYAATSRNAVMFGNMYSDSASNRWKQLLEQMDKDMAERLANNQLTVEEQQKLSIGELDKKPGTTKYITYCSAKWSSVINAAENLIKERPELKALKDAIAKDYAEQYDRMNEVSINEFNAPVHRTKCYVPLVRLESNGDTNLNQVKEDLLATMGQDAGKQWVNKGMTQRRVNISPLYQKPVQTGLYKTWADSVDRTEHFIAYSAYVRELNGVYKSRDAQYTRRFIESRYGKGMLAYIDDYINEVANPNANRTRSAGDELIKTLRGKTAPAYLAWKVSSIVKQGLTSPMPYMQFLRPDEYLASCFKCITQKGTYDAITEKSAFMKNRVMDPMNDLVSEMEANSAKLQGKLGKAAHALDAFNKKGMAGLEWIDWVCVAPGWLACYNKKLAELNAVNEQIYNETKQRLTEENYMVDVTSREFKTAEQIDALAQKAMIDEETEAIKYADDCVRLCQPSNRSVDIAPLFKNSSEFAKAYLQFQTSLNVIWQNIRYDLPYAVRQKEFKQVTGMVIGYVLAGIFLNTVIDGTGGDDDKDGEKADDILRRELFYATTQFTDSVPMIGSAVTQTMEKVITGKTGFSTSGTDMTPMVTKFLNVIKNAAGGNWDKAAKNFAEGVEMSAGLPVQGVKEIGKIAGIGDGDGKLSLNLDEVYGILDKE